MHQPPRNPEPPVTRTVLPFPSATPAAYAWESGLAWRRSQSAYPCRMTRVKVCGMTNLADAEHAASQGAWAIGLIHHPESPRYVQPAVAEEIGAALKRRCEVAGVFVNSPLDEVIEAAERESLTLLQFHGEEGPSFCVEAGGGTAAKVIKAMRVTSAADVQAAEGV